MESYTIALFGEAEKGLYRTPHLCKSLHDLSYYFGNPPDDSRGMYYAIQAILYERDLIFLRVEEEGYSVDDYLAGFKVLKDQQLAAICMPGVHENRILNAIQPIIDLYQSILITNEADFYDYMTTRQ